MALLLMEHPDELKKLQRDGFIKPLSPDSWRLVDLVQVFARAVRKPDAAVSAGALAAHLGCVRSYLDKLLTMGVITRLPDGRFDQAACRMAYLKHLREARKLLPRGAADVALEEAKAELVQLRVAVRPRSFPLRSTKLASRPAGVILSALSSSLRSARRLAICQPDVGLNDGCVMRASQWSSR
jgi:hypothetical protein